MATLTIKNLPDDLYATLTRTAKKHRRSINSEAILQLEQALGVRVRNRQDVLEEIREFREEMARKGVFITDEILEEAKKERRF